MKWDMLYAKAAPPTWEQIAEYIDNPLWEDFNERLQSVYQVKPCMEYSCCSMQAGWNVKYRKSGKALCTLYPMEGYFIALVVVGPRELTEAELLIPLCSDYVQTVFQNTKAGNGQKWLMLDVRNHETIEDVFRLIYLRKRVPSKKRGGE